jgi:hypothetical protein
MSSRDLPAQLDATASSGVRGLLATAYSDLRSMRKPTLRTTWYWVTLPFSACPRTSATSNQVTLSMVCEAVAMALFIASEMLSGDVPTRSIFL